MPKPPVKQKLALLFSQLSLFQPERNGSGRWTGRFLVNQSKVDERISSKQYKTGAVSCPPDRDDLLHMIGEASMELKAFMDEYDQMSDQLRSFVSDGMLISEMIDGAIGQLPVGMPGLEKLDILIGRYRQLYDLLFKIANDIPTADVKERAKNFLAWKGDTIKPLVNKNHVETENNA